MFNTNYLILKMLSLPAVLIALVLHEYAHGYTAWKLGDPTSKRMGRLTLNPMAHLDPVGAVLMVLVGFGWAKPVPVDPRNFKNPRKGMALTALMGPMTNLLIAFVSAFLYLLTRKRCLLAETAAVLPVVIINFLYYLSLFFYVLHTLNLSLCVFNLIPLPPLDGSRILGMFLPGKGAQDRYDLLCVAAFGRQCVGLSADTARRGGLAGADGADRHSLVLRLDEQGRGGTVGPLYGTF